MRTKSKEAILGTAETARRLGLRLDYLYSLLRAGRIRASKRDGHWEIPVQAVEQRLRAREARNG